MRKRFLFTCLVFFSISIAAQVKKAPDRKEGEGPWTQLIIRGVIMINGTGAPAIGPVDIVVEKNQSPQISRRRQRTELRRHVLNAWLYRYAWSYWW
jgi:hypothetical protein